MISQSDIRPQAFSIVKLANGMSEIIFNTEITEKEIVGIEQEPKKIYESEMFEVLIATRDGLEEDITLHYQEWLSFAKGQGQKPVSDKEKIAMLEEKASVTDDLLAELIMGGM